MKIKPLHLKDGEMHQAGADDTLDPGVIPGSTISRFDPSREYAKGDIVIWSEQPYQHIVDPATVGFIAPSSPPEGSTTYYYHPSQFLTTATLTPGYEVPSGWLEGKPPGWVDPTLSPFLGWALWEAKAYLAPQLFSSVSWWPLGSASKGDPGTGNPGDPGAPAKTLILTSDIQYYKYGQNAADQRGAPMPLEQFITFTAATPNVSGDVTWQVTPTPQDFTIPYSADLLGATGSVSDVAGENMQTKAVAGDYGFSFENPTAGEAFTGAIVDTGSTLRVPVMYLEHLVQATELTDFTFEGGLTVRATVADGDGASFSDEVNVYKLSEGENSFVFMLSNSNHTTSAGTSGYPLGTIPLAGGQFKLFKGTQDVTDSAAYSIISSDGITAAISETSYSLSDPDSDDATIVFRASHSGFDFDRTYTHSISRQGPPGFSLIRGDGLPGLEDGNTGDWYLDDQIYRLYGPKLATGTDAAIVWNHAGFINLVGAGVDSDLDGTVDCMITEGYLGHKETITRDFNVPADVNGLLIDSATVAEDVNIDIIGDLIVGGPQGAHTSSSTGTINVKDYGLVANNETYKVQNTTKLLELLIHGMSEASCIYFPAGTYYLDAGFNIEFDETLKYPLAIRGEGPGVTTIRWTSDAATAGFSVVLPPASVSDGHFFSLSGMTLETEDNFTENRVAIRVDGKNQIQGGIVMNRVTPRCSLSDLVIKGATYRSLQSWSHGIIFDDVQITDVENVTFLGSMTDGNAPVSWQQSTTGLTYKGNGYSTDHFVSNYRAVACKYGIAVFGLIEGLNVTQSTFLICTQGINWNTGPPTPTPHATPMLQVSDCHFDVYEYGIYANHVHQPNIHHNLFYVRKLDPDTGGDSRYTPVSLALEPFSTGGIVDANIFWDTEVGLRGESVRIAGSFHRVINNSFQQDADATPNEAKILLTSDSFNNTVTGNSVSRSLDPVDVALGGHPIPVKTHDTDSGMDEVIVVDYGADLLVTITGLATAFQLHELVETPNGSTAYVRAVGDTNNYGTDILLLRLENGTIETGNALTGALSGITQTVESTTALMGNLKSSSVSVPDIYIPRWHDLTSSTTAENPPEGGAPMIIFKGWEEDDHAKDRAMGAHTWFFEVDVLNPVADSKFQIDGDAPLWDSEANAAQKWTYDTDYPLMDADHINATPTTPDEFSTYYDGKYGAGNPLDDLSRYGIHPHVSMAKLSYLVRGQSYPHFTLHAFTNPAFSTPRNPDGSIGTLIRSRIQPGAGDFSGLAEVPVIDGKIRIIFKTSGQNRVTDNGFLGWGRDSKHTNGGNHRLEIHLDSWL